MSLTPQPLEQPSARTVTVNYDQLNYRYESMTSSIRCECTLLTEIVGGQPADEAGIRAFVAYHLGIEDEEEQEKAVQRILHEEIEPTTPDLGELPEGKLYGLRVFRKGPDGWPWLGNWMMKACLKAAASRADLFKRFLGLKGAFAEAGRMRGWKYSSRPQIHVNNIYLVDAENDKLQAATTFKEFQGRVQTPQGAMSITHRSEVIEPGTRFAFDFRYMPVKGLTQEAIESLLSLAMQVGVGSARSLERGKFRIETAEIELADPFVAKSTK